MSNVGIVHVLAIGDKVNCLFVISNGNDRDCYFLIRNPIKYQSISESICMYDDMIEIIIKSNIDLEKQMAEEAHKRIAAGHWRYFMESDDFRYFYLFRKYEKMP